MLLNNFAEFEQFCVANPQPEKGLGHICNPFDINTVNKDGNWRINEAAQASVIFPVDIDRIDKDIFDAVLFHLGDVYFGIWYETHSSTDEASDSRFPLV